MKARDLVKLMESRMVTIEMSEADLLTLHAFAVLSDGRRVLTKIIHRTISPVALRILEEREEYK